ncbi:MAG: tyrosine-type recombinase/integrase [Clostridium sp.]|nr:tyrosine-type recombinase/integrase [Clostridium sp.]
MKRIRLNNLNSITFKEGLEEYLLGCKARNLREGTLKHYRESIKTLLKFIPADTKIATFDKNTLPNFIVKCKTELDINSVTLHTYARDLKTFMYYFMRSDYMESFKLQLPKVDKKNIETYTDEELKVLLKKPDIKKCSFVTYRSWVVINFILSTGARVNSLINIKVKDIDFNNEVVYINTTKNRRPLIIPMNTTIIQILREYLRLRKPESDNDYLFCNVYGNKLTKGTLSQSIQSYHYNKAIVKTGLHRYRHTFAKKWIVSGGSVVTLQKILGHSSLTITEGYINLLTEDLKREVEQFNILEQFTETRIILRDKRR